MRYVRLHVRPDARGPRRGGLTVLLPGVGWRAIGVVGPTPVRASGRGVFAVPHVRARARTQPLVRGRAVLLLPGGRIMLAGILSWSPDRMNEEDALLGIGGDEDMLILLE